MHEALRFTAGAARRAAATPARASADSDVSRPAHERTAPGRVRRRLARVGRALPFLCAAAVRHAADAARRGRQRPVRQPHGPVAHAGAADRRTDLRAAAAVRHVRGGRAGDAGRSGRRRDPPRHGIRRLHAGAMRGVAAWHDAGGFPRRSAVRPAGTAPVRRAGSGDAAAVRRRGAAHAAEFTAFRFPRTGPQRAGRGLRAPARRRVHRGGRCEGARRQLPGPVAVLAAVRWLVLLGPVGVRTVPT